MGRIAEILEKLMPKIRRVERLREAVSAASLQSEMVREVYDAFRCLRPLRRGFTLTGIEIKYRYSTDVIGVGEWIRCKDRWQKYGTVVDSPHHFFELITEHGDRLARYVRDAIRRDFERLVRLARELHPYKYVEVSRNVNMVVKRFWAGWKGIQRANVEVRRFRVRKIVLNTMDPWSVMLEGEGVDDSYRGERMTFAVFSVDDLSMVDDLIDVLLEIYEEAEAVVGVVRRHNEAVLRKIRRLVLPYKAARELA